MSKRDLFMPDARCLRGPGWTDGGEGRDVQCCAGRRYACAERRVCRLPNPLKSLPGSTRLKRERERDSVDGVGVSRVKRTAGC